MNVETPKNLVCGALVSGLRAPVVLLSIALVLSSGCGPSFRDSCQASCSGCCDAMDRCQVGTFREACGIAGQACSTCQSDQTCTVGVCAGRGNPGPAPSAGGGAAGGTQSMAGGAAGGMRAGGSAGGGVAPTGSRCAGTTVECNGACVDLGTDESHCGRCGTQCGAGLVCSSGRCEALPTDCLAKQCPADFGCDPESRTCTRGCFSNADCRATGATCQAGSCRCSGGGTTCGGACWYSTCSCPSGSEGHPTLGCIDVDECARGTQRCGANEVCRNESPGATCDCATGFRRVGSECVVDACATNNGGCHPQATCDQFTASQVSCQCPFDLIGDGRTCSPTCTSQGACSDPALACYPSPSSYRGVCERPGVGVAGDICATNADCSRGTRCERRTGSSIGFCARLCATASCGAGETCASSSGAQVCLKLNGQPCDLLKQECSGGCYATTNGAMCASEGWSSTGASCAAANSCAAGLTCLAPGGSMNFTCTAICDPNAPACSSGACQPLGGFPGVGVCG
ncbi:MAG: EGF domain-containing protein [Myxococcales bacterium]|nr:EGF domain-containing protein [Myxococcales bacterium]